MYNGHNKFSGLIDMPCGSGYGSKKAKRKGRKASNSSSQKKPKMSNYKPKK